MVKKSKKSADEKPEVYSIKKDASGLSFTRKQFIGSLGVIGLGVALNPLDLLAEKIEDTGGLMSGFIAHDSSVLTVAFSPDNKTLASGSQNGDIKLWSLPDGKLMHKFSDHSAAVYSVHFHPESRMFASGSTDETVKIWTVTDIGLVRTIKSKVDFVNAVCYNKDGGTIAAGGSKITLWGVYNGPEGKTLKASSTVFRTLKFSPDGKFLAAGGTDNCITVWSVPDYKHIRTIKGHSELGYCS